MSFYEEEITTAETEKKPTNPLNNEEEYQQYVMEDTKKGIETITNAFKTDKKQEDYKFQDYQIDTFKQNAIEGARIVADMEKWAIRGLNIGDYILGKKPSVFSEELENIENIEKELVAKHKEIQDRQVLHSNQYSKWGKVGLFATDMVQNVFLDPSDYIFGVATGITKATRLMAKLPFIRYVYNQYDVYERTPIDYDMNDAKQVAIMAGFTGARFAVPYLADVASKKIPHILEDLDTRNFKKAYENYTKENEWYWREKGERETWQHYKQDYKNQHQRWKSWRAEQDKYSETDSGTGKTKSSGSGTIKDTKFLEWYDGQDDKGFYPSPITILTKNAKRINYDKLQERELVNVDTDYMRSIAFREDNNLPLSIYSNDAVKATSANINDTFEVYFMKVKEWQEETGEKDFPSFNDFKAFVDQVNVDYPLPLKKSIDRGTFTEENYNEIIEQVTGYKTEKAKETEQLNTFKGYVQDFVNNKDETFDIVLRSEEYASFREYEDADLELDMENVYNNALKFLELEEGQQKEYLEQAKNLSGHGKDDIWSADDGKGFFQALEEVLDFPEFHENGMGLGNKAILMKSVFSKKSTAAAGNLKGLKAAYGRGTKDDVVIFSKDNLYKVSEKIEKKNQTENKKTFSFYTLGYVGYLEDRFGEVESRRIERKYPAMIKIKKELEEKYKEEEFLKEFFTEEKVNEMWRWKTEDYQKAQKYFDVEFSKDHDILFSDYFAMANYLIDKVQKYDEVTNRILDAKGELRSLGLYLEYDDSDSFSQLYRATISELWSKFMKDVNEEAFNKSYDNNTAKEAEFMKAVSTVVNQYSRHGYLDSIKKVFEDILNSLGKEFKNYFDSNSSSLKNLQGAIEIPQAEATKILSVSNKNFDEATKDVVNTLKSIDDLFKLKNKDADATDQEIDDLLKDRPYYIIFDAKNGFGNDQFVGIVKGASGKYHVLRKSVLPEKIDFHFPKNFQGENEVSRLTPLIFGGVDKPSELFNEKFLSKTEQKKLRKMIAKGSGHGEGKSLILNSVLSYVDFAESVVKVEIANQYQDTVIQIFGKDSEENARVELNRKTPYWISRAIENYNNGSFYREFNQKVIDGNYKSMSDRELKTLRDFEEYFAIGEPLKENMVFYRGFRLEGSNDSWFDDVVKNLQVGDVMGNRSFLSTSHTPLVPTYFANVSNKHSQSYFMNIEVPKGTIVLPFGKNANFTSENEVLLNKDNAFYIKDIKEVEYNGQKVKIIDAILIDGDYKEFLSKDDKRPYYRVDGGKQLYIKRYMQGVDIPFEFELNNLRLKNAEDIEAVKELIKIYKMVQDVTDMTKQLKYRIEDAKERMWDDYDSDGSTEDYNKQLLKFQQFMDKLDDDFQKELISKYGLSQQDVEEIRKYVHRMYVTGGKNFTPKANVEVISSNMDGTGKEERLENITNIIFKTFEAHNKIQEALKKQYEEVSKDYERNLEIIDYKLTWEFDSFSRSITTLKNFPKFDFTNPLNAEDLKDINDFKRAYWYVTELNRETADIARRLNLNIALIDSEELTQGHVGGTAFNIKKNQDDGGQNIIIINTGVGSSKNIGIIPIHRSFDTGWIVDETPVGCITHELGHALDYFLSDYSSAQFGGFEILKDAFEKHGLSLVEEINSGKLAQLLSEYPIKSFGAEYRMGARETFAEAFNLAFNPNAVFYDDLMGEIIGTFKKEVMRAFKLKLKTQGKSIKYLDGEISYNKLEVPPPDSYKYFEETESSKIDLKDEKIKADSEYMKKNGIPFEKTSLGNAGVRLPKIYSDLRDGLVPDIKPDALIIDYGAGMGWKEQFRLREEAGIKNNVVPYDKYADPAIADWTSVEDAIRKAKGEGKDVVIISSNVLNVIPIREIFGENKDNAYVEDLVKELERLANEYDTKAVITVYEGEPKNKYKPAIMGTGTYQSNMPLAYYTKFFDDKSKLSVGKYILYDPNKKYPTQDQIKDNSFGKVVGGNRYKYIGDNRILVTDAKTGEYKFTGIVDDWNGKFEPTIIKFDYPDGKFKVPSLAARQVYHSKHLFVDNPNAPQYQLSKARAEKIDAELKRLDISKKAIGYETKWNEYLKQMNLDAPAFDGEELKSTLNKLIKDYDFELDSKNLKETIFIANVDGKLFGIDGEADYYKGKSLGRGMDHNTLYSSKELDKFDGRDGFYEYTKHIAVVVPETREVFYGGNDKKILAAIKKLGYEIIKNEKEWEAKQGIEVNYTIYKDGAAGAKAAKIKQRKKDIKKVKAVFKNLNRNEELKVDVFETLSDEDKIRYMNYFNMQFNVKPLKKDIQNYNASLNKAYRDIIATRASAGGAFWSSAALKDLIPVQEGESYLFGKVDVQNTNVRYKDKRTGEQRQKTLVSSQVAYVMTQEKNGKRHLRVYHMSSDNEFQFVEEIDGTMRTLTGRKEEEYYKKIEKNVEILEESEAVGMEKERVPANDPVTISGDLEKDYSNVINNLHNLTKKLVDQDNDRKVGIDIPLSVRNILRPLRYHFNNIVRYKAYDVKYKLWGDTKFNQILDNRRMLNLKTQLSAKGLIEAMQTNTPLNIEGVNPDFIQNLRGLWERAVQFKSKDTGVALDNKDFYMGIDTFYNKNLFQSQLFKLKEGAIDAELKEKLLENLKEEFIPMLEDEEFLQQFFIDHTKTNRDKNGSAYLNHADIADYYYKDRASYVKMYDGMEREIEDILGNIIKNAIKEEMNMSILDNLKTVAYAKFDSEDAKTLASIDSQTKLEISKEIDYLKMEAGRIVSRNVSSSKEVVEDYNNNSKLANAINKNPIAIMLHDFMAWKYLNSFNYLAEAPLNNREIMKGLRDYGIINNAQYLGKSFNYLGQYGDMLKTHFHFVRGLKQLKDDDVMQVKNLKDRELMRIYLNQKMMNEKDYSDFSKMTQFNHKLGQIGGAGQGFSDLQRKLLAEWSLYKEFGKGLKADIGKEKMKGLLHILGIDEMRFRDIQTALNVIDKDYLYELLFEKGEGDSEVENDIKRLFNNIVEDSGKDFDIFNRATGLEEHIVTKLLLMYRRYSLRMSTKIWRENTTTMDEDGLIYDNTRAGFDKTFTAEHFADNATDFLANTSYAFNRGLGKIAIALLMGAAGLGTTTYYAVRSQIDGFIEGDYFHVTFDLATANLIDNAGITVGFGGSTPIASLIENVPYRYKLGSRAGLSLGSTAGYSALAFISPEVVARSIDLYSLKRNMPSNITTSSEKAAFAYKNYYKQDGKMAQMEYDMPPLFLFIPRAAGAIYQLMLKDDDLSSKASGIYDDGVDKELKAHIATENLITASEAARNHAVAVLSDSEIDRLGIGYEDELNGLSDVLRGKYIEVVNYLGLDDKQKIILLHKLNDFNTEQEQETFLLEQVPKNKRDSFK